MNLVSECNCKPNKLWVDPGRFDLICFDRKTLTPILKLLSLKLMIEIELLNITIFLVKVTLKIVQ